MKCLKKKDYFRNITEEKQQYIEYLNKLIENLNRQCIIIQNQISVLHNKLKIKTDNNLLCSICMENQVNTAIIPCGHTFCSKCLSENSVNNFNKCSLCRNNILHFFKIYI